LSQAAAESRRGVFFFRYARVVFPLLIACAAWPSGIDERVVVPPDGATGVPLNARVYVEYAPTNGNAKPSVELHAPDGTVIAATLDTTGEHLVDTVVLQPDAPLDAGTTYEVWDGISVPCLDSCDGTPTRIASFTTGDALDTAPPTLGALEVSSGYESEGPGSGCDWWGDQIVHGLSQPVVGDDGPLEWIRYVYYDEQEHEVAGPVRFGSAGHDCGAPPWWPLYTVWVGTDTFSVRAVDLAGNLSEPRLLHGASCEALMPTPDAGLGGDDAGTADGGCCSGSAGAGSWLLAGLVTLLAGKGWHRRSRRCPSL
jgi:hypothetical protein